MGAVVARPGTDPANQPPSAIAPIGTTIDSTARRPFLPDRTRITTPTPGMLKRQTCGREASAVSLYDLCFRAGKTWQEQAERAFR